MKPLTRFQSLLPQKSKQEIQKIKTPYEVQDFLYSMPYNAEERDRSPLNVILDGQCHCLDGGFLAAILLWNIGVTPLVLDLTNPSPSLGWDNSERDSFNARGPVDMALALAVIHHLAISNNVPLPQLASFFAARCQWLVIEFVPKSDSQVQKLLASREDIFPNYTREGFEAAFSARFKIHSAESVRDSERTLYLMQRK